MNEPRNIVITPALPYANGSIHLGHMLEHVMCDVLARYYRLRGHRCLLICADDTHGTPIMLGAKARGISLKNLLINHAKSIFKISKALKWLLITIP